MADVMPRGHDGDGREDPPPPGGQSRGQHEMDVVPPNRRGKAKNLALFSKWKDNGKRPLPLEFDDATSTTVGKIHDLFIREIGVYIWREISLDRESWKKVTPAEKNAMFQHLRPYFDVERVMDDSGQSRLKDGLEYMISARYRGRKTKAKEYFIEKGGYEDVERARA